MKSPIFIFSLPRSGSTLLQKILMRHTQVTSIAEPWVLLALSAMYRKNGVIADYSHGLMREGVSQFRENVGAQYFDDKLSGFVTELYKSLCNNDETYFVDKTPRYHLIINEISELFPSAKFIFLFRNPLSILGSIVSSWENDRLNRLYYYDIDLVHGLENVSQGYKKLSDRSISVKYEDMVSSTEKTILEILDYLELDYEPSMIKEFSEGDLKGEMGDETGPVKYKKISVESIDEWKTIFNTRYRKKFITRYVKRLSDESLSIQGYNKYSLVNEISLIDEKKKINFDRIDVVTSCLIRKMHLNIFLSKKMKWTNDLYLN